MPGGSGKGNAALNDDEYFHRYIAKERKKQAAKRKGQMTYDKSNMPLARGMTTVGGLKDVRHNIA